MAARALRLGRCNQSNLRPPFCGQPFFVVTKAVDPGLVKVIEEEIVPRLERDAPQLVSEPEFSADPLRHRFLLAFDREGYSPVLFAKMKKKRIACSTYRRRPGPDWPAEEFAVEPVTLTNGETVEMVLAERGVHYESAALWVREIRRRTESGHQTAIVSTDYLSPRSQLAAPMFGRWGQENFFRYMLEHYGLDRLVSYGIESIPQTTRVVNPAHRTLDAAVRKRNGLLSRRRAEFAALTLDQPLAPKPVQRWEQKKAALYEEIVQIDQEIVALKAQRKATARHIAVKDLPAEHRFSQLHCASKHFIDTIKMVAYRAETAMVHVVRDVLSHHDDARSLLRALYSNDCERQVVGVAKDHEGPC